MKFNRRNFNRISSLSLFGLSFFKRSTAQAMTSNVLEQDIRRAAFPIFQGATDESSTIINILLEKGQQLQYSGRETSSMNVVLPQEITEIEIPYTNKVLATCYFNQLELSKNYEFLVSDSSQTIVDQRNFHLLAESGAEFNFALGSCMNEYKHKDWIYHSLEDQNPEALFLIGDQVYADKPSSSRVQPADEKQLWQRYAESRLKIEFFRLKNLIPTFSSWDDHDIGKDNCNRTYEFIDLAQNIFDLFFPCDPTCSFVTRGPGNSKLIKLRGQDFFMLDGRSFRSEKSAADETMFGQEQDNWLFKNLVSDRVSWLMSGTQWSVNYSQTENFIKTHPNAFKSFMSSLKGSGAKVVFASGDVHFSEITKVDGAYLGYETIEFTASSFHSTFFPGMDRFLANSNRIASKATQNFLMVNCQKLGPHLFEGKVGCISKSAQPIFEVDFSIGFNGPLSYFVKFGPDKLAAARSQSYRHNRVVLKPREY